MNYEHNERTIIEIANRGNDICSGCGGYTVDGGTTGNPNIKHFTLLTGWNSATRITYCNECAAQIAQFLLQAWEE